MFYIVEHDMKVHQIIDNTGKANKYGKAKLFNTAGDAVKWLSKSINYYEARYGLVDYHTGREAVRYVRYFKTYRQAREYLETIPASLYNYSAIIRRYHNGET